MNIHLRIDFTIVSQRTLLFFTIKETLKIQKKEKSNLIALVVFVSNFFYAHFLKCLN